MKLGFLKGLGKFAGDVVGAVVSTPVRLAAEITDNKFLHESADMIYSATLRTGTLVGQAAEGTVDLVGGALTNDKEKRNRGGEELFGAVESTTVGIGKGIYRVGESVYEVGRGVVEGDMQLVRKGAETLGKVALTSVFAVGIVDAVDGAIDIGGADTVDTSTPDTVAVETHVDGYVTGDGTQVDDYWAVRHMAPENAENLPDGDHFIASNPDHPTTVSVEEHVNGYTKEDGTQVDPYTAVRHETI